MTNLIHEGDQRRKKEMNLRHISFSLNQQSILSVIKENSWYLSLICDWIGMHACRLHVNCYRLSFLSKKNTAKELTGKFFCSRNEIPSFHFNCYHLSLLSKTKQSKEIHIINFLLIYILMSNVACLS